MGFAGGDAGRRDSGVRHVDDYRGTYEALWRIEKPGSSPGFRFYFAPFVFRNKMSAPHTFPLLFTHLHQDSLCDD
jgi:hypothetical protein